LMVRNAAVTAVLALVFDASLIAKGLAPLP
jgi:hypothetical protein